MRRRGGAATGHVGEGTLVAGRARIFAHHPFRRVAQDTARIPGPGCLAGPGDALRRPSGVGRPGTVCLSGVQAVDVLADRLAQRAVGRRAREGDDPAAAGQLDVTYDDAALHVDHRQRDRHAARAAGPLGGARFPMRDRGCVGNRHGANRGARTRRQSPVSSSGRISNPPSTRRRRRQAGRRTRSNWRRDQLGSRPRRSGRDSDRTRCRRRVLRKARRWPFSWFSRLPSFSTTRHVIGACDA